MKNHIFRFTLFTLLATTLWNCQAQPKDFDKVVYAYQDSSVPPEYHRSYTIVWQANGKGLVSVDVYNDTIAQQNFKIKAEDFKKLQNLAKNIQSGGKKTSNASGTSHQLIQLFSQKKKVYDRYWDNLNKENKATKSFVEFIKEKTPNLDNLLTLPYDVTTTSNKELFGKKDYDKLIAFKTALTQVKTSEEEANIFKEIFEWSRKQQELTEEPAYNFHLGIKNPESNKGDTLKFYVYAEKYNTPSGTPFEERVEWEVNFAHKLLASDSFGVLLLE